jgi:site-specific DNA-methyltransferase (adenine-specific)
MAKNLPINEIICGDCLEVMQGWPDNCVDLVLTDPPYGLNDKMQGGTWGVAYRNGDMMKWDYVVKQEDIESAIRKGKNAILWGANNYIMIPSRCWLVWEKPYFPTMSDNELAWTSFDKPAKSFRHNRIGNVNGHPTEKPLPLMLWCVENYSNPTDLILDPFCGSGTTCVAAKMLGRNYIGIDISEEYCKIARERLEAVETGVPVKEARKGQMGLF